MMETSRFVVEPWQPHNFLKQEDLERPELCCHHMCIHVHVPVARMAPHRRICLQAGLEEDSNLGDTCG